jgi:transposase
MQLKTILNRIQKHRGFVYGTVRMAEEPAEPFIEIEIRPHGRNRPGCSGCSKKGPGYDTLPLRLFEFVPLWGIPVFFAYAMRRVDCPRCGVTVESVPWAEGKNQLTTTYAWFLAGWAKRMSWRDVARAFRTSWENVFRSVELAVTWGREHMDLGGIKAVGIDEIQWHRGHKYLTLAYQIDPGCKRLLWIGEERKAKTLLRFFRWLGRERTAAIQFVCSDMWKPYLKVIAKKAGQAIHVLDRFHIMSHMNKAIDEVRAQEARALKAKGHEPLLKHSRWLLLKRPENLNEKQEVRLAEIVRLNLRSVRSYLLREDFQGFWEYVSPNWAGEFLDRWCTRTMRSKIEPMKKVARMLRRHRDLLLNWFRAKGQISAGTVEGLNLKVKLTTRKAYGFRTFRAIEIALFHTLGALPEPETTHKFC